MWNLGFLGFLSSLFGRLQLLHQFRMEFLHGRFGSLSRNNFDLANDLTVFVKDLALFIWYFAGAFRGIRVFGKLTNSLSLFV